MPALLDPVRYAAPNASIRARLSDLLPKYRWPQLLAASNLADVVALLGTTAYSVNLESLMSQSPEPEQVEQNLRTHLVQAFRAPLKLLQGKPRTFLDWLWRRFELANLKSVIRATAAGLPGGQTRATLIPLGIGSDLPWNTLIEAQSVRDLLAPLRTSFYGERYAHALEPAIERYRRDGELFVLEVALDLAYYRRLLRLLDGLSGRDRQDAERFIAPMIDGYNLSWAFRYRVFFDLSPEEIISYTLQRRLKVDAALVRQVATGMSLQEAAHEIWNDRMPNLERLNNLPLKDALPELELLLRRYRYQLAQQTLKGFPFRLGTILAYTVLLESEVQDLTTIVEGKTARVSANYIQSQLIDSRG